jgi:hypothetical protein
MLFYSPRNVILGLAESFKFLIYSDLAADIPYANVVAILSDYGLQVKVQDVGIVQGETVFAGSGTFQK